MDGLTLPSTGYSVIMQSKGSDLAESANSPEVAPDSPEHGEYVLFGYCYMISLSLQVIYNRWSSFIMNTALFQRMGNQIKLRLQFLPNTDNHMSFNVGVMGMEVLYSATKSFIYP